MSSEVEFTGSTVEQAVAKACQHLDIKEEYLNFTVISEGSSGIFGLLGVKKALIRVINQDKQGDRNKSTPVKRLNSQKGATAVNKPADLDDAAGAGLQTVEKIANSITAGARVTMEKEGKRVSYEIKGGKAGLLIGKGGQTLEAIQYLVEKIVNRRSRERLRVSIDVGGYLAKKIQKLENLAVRTALKVKKNSKPVTLGQLNAHDRRIIHLTLKSDSDVFTKSIGNGFLRKLVVLPKKRRRNPKGRV